MLTRRLSHDQVDSAHPLHGDEVVGGGVLVQRLADPARDVDVDVYRLRVQHLQCSRPAARGNERFRFESVDDFTGSVKLPAQPVCLESERTARFAARQPALPDVDMLMSAMKVRSGTGHAGGAALWAVAGAVESWPA